MVPDMDVPVPNHNAIDALPTIADGRAVLMPVDSPKLHCLDLQTGALRWTLGNGTMWFIGCVWEGKVVVAGEHGINALRLSDGAPAWPRGMLELPGGARPSGRGFRSGAFYWLPTDKAELLKIDLAEGQLAARVKVDAALGNLLGLSDRLISQTAEGVQQFGGDRG
jgi:outer membrane protein assembly factor BamB